MTELQKQTKGIFSFHSKNIQHVVHKYLHSRRGMWESINAKHKNSKKAKLPYKQKKFFTSGWDYQSIKIDYDKGVIKLSKPKLNNRPQEPVKCYAKSIPQNVVQVELIYRHKLLLAVKYKEENTCKQIESNNEAAIDLGEIHSITSINNNGVAVIITGRKLRSDKRLRNKEQGKIRNKMSKCKLGSRKYKKYKKALNKLSKKFERKELDSIHKISRLYTNYCVESDVKKVYYGDLDSCTRNTKKRIGKKVGQKLNEWSYGLLMLQLENKLTRHNIELVKISEAYSSQRCPLCGNLTKAKGRNYNCKHCNYTQHRDVNGAINILNMNSEKHKIAEYKELRYLRIA